MLNRMKSLKKIDPDWLTFPQVKEMNQYKNCVSLK